LNQSLAVEEQSGWNAMQSSVERNAIAHQRGAKSGAESLVLCFLPKTVLQNVAWHFLKAPNLVPTQA
jgi:hypothetical protein